ncbi:carbohydrate ABC transporter permease [Ructibacterium gallinarum]|uniref:Carbohydrate ABC transporter permease n=1 Tax=Ructibacterium gallinarum TaxID=2779355 RepID=A0A9D5M5Z6_9FIRM|nr:carbohydrate ABC transporter permease [Ructibacterium gallinarum]MBE5040189.1 carbohydrate ABC transporter permease [Ructibacterium gallinarum]
MKIRKTAEDILIDVISYAVMGLFGLITLIPFLNIIAKTFSEDWAVVSGKVGILPIGFQLDSLEYVITSSRFLTSFLVSVIITVAGTALSILLICVTAYPLSKKKLWGVKGVMILYVFTMMFSGGMIPNYLLIKNLGIYNTLWSVILPGMINVFNLMIVKNYFESIPESVEESAMMDGASHTRVLFTIVLPLAVPTIATITLFTAVNYWNNYMGPMLYINEPGLKPLQLYLREIILEQSDAVLSSQSVDDQLNISSEGVRSATIIASTLPILLVYPFIQKYFIKGIMIGSVKG